MNKNRGIKILLGISLFMLIGVVPVETYAVATSGHVSSAAEKSCTSEDGKTSCVEVCANYSKISFDVSPYTLNTAVHNSTVAPRIVTITSLRKFKVYYWIADYNQLDGIGEDSNSNEEDDVEAKHKTVKTRNKQGKYEFTYKLQPGNEVQFVVFSQGENDSLKKYCVDKDCKTKAAIKCPNGKLTLGGSDIDVTKLSKKVKFDESGIILYNNKEYLPTQVEIGGNSASLFVQNPGPGDSGLVDNIRYFNEETKKTTDFNKACANAYNGVYDDKNVTLANKFTIDKSDQVKWLDWYQNYYSKVLTYCKQPQFAYNLSDKKIKEISNTLLEMFYHSNLLLTNANKSIGVAVVRGEIDALKANILEKYRLEGVNGNSHILEEGKGQSPVVSDLQCNYKNVMDDKYYQTIKDTVGNTDQEFQKRVRNEEYLYIKKEESQTATIKKNKKDKKGTPIKVCSTLCYEHLTVTYDAPKTVKAGMCLSYKVTVKSETKCGVDTVPIDSSMLAPKECSPVPICSNNEKSTQAGPSEEFDQCVNKCDGGKYTQNCINECYEKVYKNETDKQENTSSKKTSSIDYKDTVSFLHNTIKTNDYEVMKLATYTTKQLKNYYKESGYSKCNTRNIKNNIDECAEYYFYAKSLYPMGEYDSSGTKWISDDAITKAGATELGVSNIPMQIGRAAPFYLRSKEATKDLILDLLGIKSTSIYKKYNIKYGKDGKDGNGIKRQYSTRYRCDETCSFTGCNSSDSMDSGEYAEILSENVKAIKEALEGCNASAECEATSSTADFEIKVNTERINNDNQETIKTGKTHLTSTIGDDAENNTVTMFVPRKDDRTETGILGQCYENTVGRPHYQTTITFPGSWTDLKTGKVYYVKQDEHTSNLHVGEYCTPWDAKDVNVPYWMWAWVKKFQGNLDSSFTPEYNITATLGDQDNKFGKYGWSIKFSCFYALNNENCDCENNPKECPNPELCPKKEENECNSENSTKLCNYKFRVIDQADMFPSASQTTPRKVGFNWTASGKDLTVPENSTYRVDPEKYYKELQNLAQSGENAVYDVGQNGGADYTVILTKENIAAIKAYIKKNGNKFTDFKGTYSNTLGTDPKGLRHYNISSEVNALADITRKSGINLENNDNTLGRW